MSQTSKVRLAGKLFLFPSTYGLISWAFWLFAYSLRLMDWDPCCWSAIIVFGATLATFLVGTILAMDNPTPDIAKKPASASSSPSNLRGLMSCMHVIGFAGIALYVYDYSNALGGISTFVQLLLNQSHVIRWETAMTASAGTQISYFGWAAAAITASEIGTRRLDWRWTWTVFLQIALNTLWIDRTRPLWIGFTCLLAFLLPRAATLNWLRVARVAVVAVTAILILFVSVSLWTGKTWEAARFEIYGESHLSGPPELVYIYGTGGLAYFNHMMDSESFEGPISATRTMYPVVKVLYDQGLIDTPPPAQVLAVWHAPFPTNVGTFLEPLYRDAGILGLVLGLGLHSFGFNWLARIFLRRGNALTVLGWSHLCFVNLISPFVPKLGSPPLWFFLMVTIAGLRLVRPDDHAPAESPAPQARVPCPRQAP